MLSNKLMDKIVKSIQIYDRFKVGMVKVMNSSSDSDVTKIEKIKKLITETEIEIAKLHLPRKYL